MRIKSQKTAQEIKYTQEKEHTMNRKNSCRWLLLPVLVLICFLCIPNNVKAAAGKVYACTINRCYRHPVTGVIEDSGGEAAYTTGQGMVEGCIEDFGMFEETADGRYYLTFRMGLIDYTSNQTFQVQNWGDDAWTDPEAGITGKGTDENGTTWDVTVEVPSRECVIRGSMYVEPMGRDVIFYLYPSDFVESDDLSGANGMTAMMVSGGASSGNEGSTDETESGSSSQTVSENESAQTAGTDSQEGENSVSSDDVSGNGEEETLSAVSGADSEAGAVDTAAGLNLSTENEDDEDDTADIAASNTGTGFTVGQQILINIVSFSVSGAILLIIAAGLVYFMRKNWKRWGGEDNDDYSALYKKRDVRGNEERRTDENE